MIARMDKVDRIVSQWQQERPDLDVGSMELIGRFKRIGQFLGLEMTKTFADYGLNAANFDVLATLRRSGAPYALSPNELINSTMVTSGTMTNRIDQLVKSGLVERIRNKEDARSVVVSLSNKGIKLIDSMLATHVDTQDRLMAGLTAEEKKRLNSLMRKILIGFEGQDTA